MASVRRDGCRMTDAPAGSAVDGRVVRLPSRVNVSHVLESSWVFRSPVLWNYIPWLVCSLVGPVVPHPRTRRC